MFPVSVFQHLKNAESFVRYLKTAEGIAPHESEHDYKADYILRSVYVVETEQDELPF